MTFQSPPTPVLEPTSRFGLIEFVRSLTEDKIWHSTCFSMGHEGGTEVTEMLRGKRVSARSPNQALNN